MVFCLSMDKVVVGSSPVAVTETTDRSVNNVQFFLPGIFLQWYQQKNTAYRIQLSACLKSYESSQLYNRFRR